MSRVRFTNKLIRLFPNLDTVHVNETNVADLVQILTVHTCSLQT